MTSEAFAATPAATIAFDKSKSIYLEFYRGVAAMGVAISHYFAAKGSLSSEFLAIFFVEMFFPLSGFILAPQVLRVFNNRSSLPVFLLRRWFRTIPLYFLGLFCIALITHNFFSDQFNSYMFFYHFFFLDYTENNFYPISWSLAAEEYYYFIMPVFIIMLPRIRLIDRVVIFLCLGLAIKLYLAFFYPASFVRIATVARIDSIGVGFLCYLLMDRFRSYHLVAAGVAVIVATVLHNLFHNSATVLPYIYAANIFFGIVCAVLYRTERLAPCRNRIFRAVAKMLGSSSYAVYVLHLIVLTIAIKADIDVVTYSILVLLLSRAVHEYFELPIMNLRPNYRDSSGRAQ